MLSVSTVLTGLVEAPSPRFIKASWRKRSINIYMTVELAASVLKAARRVLSRYRVSGRVVVGGNMGGMGVAGVATGDRSTGVEGADGVELDGLDTHESTTRSTMPLRTAT